MRLFHILLLILIFIYSCELFKDDEPYYEIAYTSSDDDYLYILIIDTEHLKPKIIVQTNNTNLYSLFFHDYENIFFCSEGDIYQSDLSGNKINLTNTPFWETEYSLPKSGDKMIYKSYQDETNDDHRTEIYLLDLISGNKQRLTYSKYCSFSPLISPDGNLFCFQSDNSLDSNDASLILRDFNGTIDDTLSNNAWTPAFSPDSKLLCYTVAYEGLYVTDIESHHSILLDNAFYPMFSPDGEMIYYYTSLDSELVIARINVDGTNKQYFNTGQLLQGRFDISSDGELIVFEKFEDYGISSIYTIDYNGNNLTKIVDQGHFPVFRPK